MGIQASNVGEEFIYAFGWAFQVIIPGLGSKLFSMSFLYKGERKEGHGHGN